MIDQCLVGVCRRWRYVVVRSMMGHGFEVDRGAMEDGSPMVYGSKPMVRVVKGFS